MLLNIGDHHRIDNPTLEQIEHALRNLPEDAPFLILDADDEQFIQTTLEGALWRVEWRHEGQQRFLVTDFRQMQEAFSAFHRSDESELTSLPWKQLTLWNDPYQRVVLVVGVTAGLLVVIAMIALWSAFH